MRHKIGKTQCWNQPLPPTLSIASSEVISSGEEIMEEGYDSWD